MLVSSNIKGIDSGIKKVDPISINLFILVYDFNSYRYLYYFKLFLK